MNDEWCYLNGEYIMINKCGVNDPLPVASKRLIDKIVTQLGDSMSAVIISDTLYVSLS